MNIIYKKDTLYYLDYNNRCIIWTVQLEEMDDKYYIIVNSRIERTEGNTHRYFVSTDKESAIKHCDEVWLIRGIYGGKMGYPSKIEYNHVHDKIRPSIPGDLRTYIDMLEYPVVAQGKPNGLRVICYKTREKSNFSFYDDKLKDLVELPHITDSLNNTIFGDFVNIYMDGYLLGGDINKLYNVDEDVDYTNFKFTVMDFYDSDRIYDIFDLRYNLLYENFIEIDVENVNLVPSFITNNEDNLESCFKKVTYDGFAGLFIRKKEGVYIPGYNNEISISFLEVKQNFTEYFIVGDCMISSVKSSSGDDVPLLYFKELKDDCEENECATFSAIPAADNELRGYVRKLYKDMIGKRVELKYMRRYNKMPQFITYNKFILDREDKTNEKSQ